MVSPAVPFSSEIPNLCSKSVLPKIWYSRNISGMSPNPLSHVRLTGSEHAWRDRLKQMVHSNGLLRGTLTIRERLCGKGNCRCVDGMKHRSLYIVSRQNGKTRQLYVPKHLENKVRQWVANYLEVQRVLETISDQCWKRLEDRED